MNVPSNQDSVAGMCRNIWSRPQKVDQKHRDLTEMAFNSQPEVIEQMKKGGATSRTYKISQRVKKGAYDSYHDAINSIQCYGQSNYFKYTCLH